MENYEGGIRRFGERTASRDHSVEEFVPSAAWSDGSLNHLLLLDLPGFKKEDVKIEAEKPGEMTISGKRLVNDDKYLYFEKTFKAPENSDVEKVTGKFEGDILYVSVPKKASQSQKKEAPNLRSYLEEEKTDNMVKEKQETLGLGEIVKENFKDEKEESKKMNEVDGFKKEEVEKWSGQNSMLERAAYILVTAALAFSLGVFLSRKSQSS